MSLQPIDRQPPPIRRSEPMPRTPGTVVQPGFPPRGRAASSLPLLGGVDILRAIFADVFGGALTELAERFWGDYLNDVPFEVIVAEVRKTPEYKARFPAMAELRNNGRPISEAQYLGLERQYAQNRREFGLRPGFYDDPSDFAAVIANEVSPDEDRRRLQAWQTWDRETRDPVAEQQFRAQASALGIDLTDGDFLMFALDPDRAVTTLERALSAGTIATEAVRAGYGPLTGLEGQRLADLGINQDVARQGFDALAGSRELFAPLPGETGAGFGREEQIGAAFGTDAAARRRLDAQRRRRIAEFDTGGGYSTGRGGLTGLAPAE